MMRGARCRSRPRPALRRLGAVLLCILCAGCSTGGTTAIATEGGQVSDGRVSDGRVSDGLATSPPPATDDWIKVSDSIRIDRARGAVRFDATAVIAEGFLEQYVCIAGTRDHESLFAFAGKASEIHAAMLLVGLEPGSPGRWRQLPAEEGSFKLELTPPRGDALIVSAILPSGAEHPLQWFVRASPVAPASAATEPPSRFVFAGSHFGRSARTQREFYAADASGSLVGLVTFGDETIAAVEVIPDQVEASPAVWEVFVGRMPPPGTTVTIDIRRGDSRTAQKPTERSSLPPDRDQSVARPDAPR